MAAREPNCGDPPPVSSTQTHRSNIASDFHQHYFENATTTLSVGPGDKLICWVYVDPQNPPQEIMLQFRQGTSFEHRAYWGTNFINLGTDGTNSRRYMGAVFLGDVSGIVRTVRRMVTGFSIRVV
jgi:hypothetical protein